MKSSIGEQSRTRRGGSGVRGGVANSPLLNPSLLSGGEKVLALAFSIEILFARGEDSIVFEAFV